MHLILRYYCHSLPLSLCNGRCRCTVHHHYCHHLAVTPSIAIAVEASIAIANAQSINVVAVVLPSRLLLPPCHHCAIHQRCRCRCTIHRLHCCCLSVTSSVTVAVAPSIAVAVAPSIAVAVAAVNQHHCHCVAIAPSIAVVAQVYHTMAVAVVLPIKHIFVVSSSIGHPSHSLAGPGELRLRVGPHALSEKKELREQGCWNPRRRVST